MANTADLIKQAIEEDPTGDDALDLVLFLLQDPVAREEIPEALDALRDSEVAEQVQTFESEVLPKAREMIESGSINGVPVFEMNRQSPGEHFAEGAAAAGKAIGTAAGIAGSIAPVGRTASVTARLAQKLISGVGGLSRGQKIAGGIAGGIGMAWLNSTSPLNDADPGTGSDHNAAAADPNQALPDADVYVRDPNTGNMVQVNGDQVAPEFSTELDPAAIGAETSFGPNMSIQEMLQQGFQSGAFAAATGRHDFDPKQLGTMTVPETMSLDPVPMQTRGGARGPIDTRIPDHLDPNRGRGRPGMDPSNIFTETFGRSPDAALSRMAESPVPGEGTLGAMDIPAGAEIAPGAFREYQGRTLLDWARVAAARYRVPLNVLYGLVDLESGWDPNAVGDYFGGKGTSFGLVQIHGPAFPNVTRSQALDPKFALDFAARMLRQRYDKYGRWDAAVAAHNSPVAANYLAETGQWYNSKSQTYTTAVLNRAQTSGLSSMQATSDELELRDSAGIGESMGGQSAVFPVEGATLPNGSQIGLPRDGGKRQHQGLDIMADEGTAVYSTTAGRVRYAANRGGKGGYAVSIEDQFGNYHYYAHLSPSSAQLWQQTGIVEGATVNPGSLIGYVGATGNAAGGAPHLHYSINEGRKDAPLIDPHDFLSGSMSNPAPEFNAFQAPDPATSRDFIRGLYADLLGRDPTAGEFQSAQERYEALLQQQHFATIRGERGLETSDIDPAARFEEEIRESGEFKFAQDREQTRSFTDYTASIAAMLQSGI